MPTTYVFHPVTSTDDPDDMWVVMPEGELIKMCLDYVSPYECEQSGWDDESGDE